MKPESRRPQLGRAARYAFIVGAAGLSVWALGLISWRAEAFRGYWFAWVFWSGVSFGSLAVVLMQFLTGGAWARLTHSPAQAGTATLPWMALLLIPAFFGIRDVFPWANLQLWTGHHWPHKQAWLTPGWFVLRSLLYFALLIPVGWLARRWGADADQPERLQPLGAGGLILYVLCMNFASLDWVMSLEPQWSSTILAVVFMIGQFLTALACSSVTVLALAARASVGRIEPKAQRDLGNLLLAFVMFWAYVSFSQFLIIWSGNLPRETSWYLHRRGGGWGEFIIVLAAIQFAVPFVLLLSRTVKQHGRMLAPVALLVFAANALAVFWQIAPSFSPGHFHLSLFDVAAFLGIGSLWLGFYLRDLSARVVLAANSQEGEVLHG